MNADVKRRALCCVLGRCAVSTCGFGALSPAFSKRLPFCEFSTSRGWRGNPAREYITHRAKKGDRSGVPNVIDRIYSALSIKPEIDIFLAEKENNAFATVAGGRKIIVVDVAFVESVNKLARTQWGAIQVIAHELGHHIAGFSEDRHRAELNADYWSGQAVQRLGASRAAASKAIMALGTESDTDTHPNKHRRAATIERGWDDALANKIDYAFCDGCK